MSDTECWFFNGHLASPLPRLKDTSPFSCLILKGIPQSTPLCLFQDIMSSESSNFLEDMGVFFFFLFHRVSLFSTLSASVNFVRIKDWGRGFGKCAEGQAEVK